MRSKQFVSTLTAPVLQSTVRNQRQPKRRMRYEPTVVYHLAEVATFPPYVARVLVTEL